MKWIFYFLSMIFATTAYTECVAGSDCCTNCILEGRISLQNPRAKLFIKTIELIRDRKLEVCVEVGTSRVASNACYEQGCATLIIADCLKRYGQGGMLYSADIDEGAIYEVKNALGDSLQCVKLIQKDPVDFLNNFDRPIDLLYVGPCEEEQAECYTKSFEAIEAALPSLTKQAVIVLDEKLVTTDSVTLDLLLDNGWKPISSEYPSIFSQE